MHAAKSAHGSCVRLAAIDVTGDADRTGRVPRILSGGCHQMRELVVTDSEFAGERSPLQRWHEPTTWYIRPDPFVDPSPSGWS